MSHENSPGFPVLLNINASVTIVQYQNMRTSKNISYGVKMVKRVFLGQTHDQMIKQNQSVFHAVATLHGLPVVNQGIYAVNGESVWGV